MPATFALRCGLLTAGTFLLTTGVRADQNLSGTFAKDNEIALFQLTALSPVSLSVLTTSFATGGFDPVLSFFNASGTLLDLNDDKDASTKDSLLSLNLAPGSYYVALTQWDNFNTGPTLWDGFVRDGDSAFTREFGGPNATGYFYTGEGEQKTGDWAVTFRGDVGVAQIPEPGTLALLFAGSVVLTGLMRRRK